MNSSHSETLVFFGATGDLACKKIFPALQAMVRRGTLNVPIIGVARAGWNLDQLKARAKDSVEKHGGLDSKAVDKLCGLLRYVDGDYNDAATFQALHRELGQSQRPAYYLASPDVVSALGFNVISPVDESVSHLSELLAKIGRRGRIQQRPPVFPSHQPNFSRTSPGARVNFDHALSNPGQNRPARLGHRGRRLAIWRRMGQKLYAGRGRRHP